MSAATPTPATTPATTPTTTRAVVIAQPGQVTLQEVALRAPGPDDVVIRTAYTSISAGTERMLLAGQMPHPQLQLPVVPGYETVGQVVAAGENVDVAWLGRWVYVGGVHCYADLNPAWGGQAATLFAPAARVVPLEGVAPEQGVLLALAATALHGVDQLAIAPGARLLVLGQGPVGQLAARLARSRGAYVIVADRAPTRLARAVADEVIHVDDTPLREAVTQPVDIIIEATGNMAALGESLSLLAPKGVILLLGYYQKLDLPYMPLFFKEARLVAVREWGAGDLQRCRDLIATGALEVASLLTHRYPIAAVEEGYAIALHDPTCLKLVFDWHNGTAQV